MFEVQAGAFHVDVATTSHGGHKPEFWAQRAADRIVQIADTAPMPIREQAIAFKDRLREVILWHMIEAIKSDRTTVCNIVDQAGRPELIKDLRSI
jgi:hypothetical protein